MLCLMLSHCFVCLPSCPLSTVHNYGAREHIIMLLLSYSLQSYRPYCGNNNYINSATCWEKWNPVLSICWEKWNPVPSAAGKNGTQFHPRHSAPKVTNTWNWNPVSLSPWSIPSFLVPMMTSSLIRETSSSF